MNNQAMTKLASEFYERGRQAALIEAGLVKVANKKKTLAALLGLGAAGGGGMGIYKMLQEKALQAEIAAQRAAQAARAGSMRNMPAPPTAQEAAEALITSAARSPEAATVTDHLARAAMSPMRPF